MKKIIIIAAILLNYMVCFGQENSYPKTIVIGSDTVGCVTKAQIIKINNTYLDYAECSDLLSNEQKTTKEQDDLIKKQEAIIASKDKQISIQDSIIVEGKSIVSNDDKIIKKEETQIKFLKIERNVLGIVAVFETLLLGVIYLMAGK